VNLAQKKGGACIISDTHTPQDYPFGLLSC
jgi:hypothetical protein